MRIDGGCHCGYIQYEAEIDPAKVGICHCTDCQHFSGSPYRASIPAPVGQFSLKGATKTYVKTAENGNRRAQVFCPECGTRMPHKVNGTENMLIPAGVLDADPGMRPTNSIFWKSKSPWYLSPQELPQFDGYK